MNPRYTKQGTLDGRVGIERRPDVLQRRHRPGEQLLQARRGLPAAHPGARGGQAGRGPVGAAARPLPPAVGCGGWRQGPRAAQPRQHLCVDRGRRHVRRGAAEHELRGRPRREAPTRGHAPRGCDFNAEMFGAAFGVRAEVTALFGGYRECRETRASERSSSFGVVASLDGERDLRQTNAASRRLGREPGKVDAYRFMTFYLDAASNHHDVFFSPGRRRRVAPRDLGRREGASRRSAAGPAPRLLAHHAPGHLRESPLPSRRRGVVPDGANDAGDSTSAASTSSCRRSTPWCGTRGPRRGTRGRGQLSARALPARARPMGDGGHLDDAALLRRRRRSRNPVALRVGRIGSDDRGEHVHDAVGPCARRGHREPGRRVLLGPGRRPVGSGNGAVRVGEPGRHDRRPCRSSAPTCCGSALAPPRAQWRGMT